MNFSRVSGIRVHPSIPLRTIGVTTTSSASPTQTLPFIDQSADVERFFISGIWRRGGGVSICLRSFKFSYNLNTLRALEKAENVLALGSDNFLERFAWALRMNGGGKLGQPIQTCIAASRGQRRRRRRFSANGNSDVETRQRRSTILEDGEGGRKRETHLCGGGIVIQLSGKNNINMYGCLTLLVSMSVSSKCLPNILGASPGTGSILMQTSMPFLAVSTGLWLLSMLVTTPKSKNWTNHEWILFIMTLVNLFLRECHVI